jgi:hypothetical protein
MTTENFRFYFQNRRIQISQTGGQWYSDTSPSIIPWLKFGQSFWRQQKENAASDITDKCIVANTIKLFLAVSYDFS